MTPDATRDDEVPHKTRESPEHLGSRDMDPNRTNPGLPVVGREHVDLTYPVGMGAPPGGDTDYEAIARGASEGVNPQNPETMPRAEDDALVFAESPEFHDGNRRDPTRGKPR